MSPEAAQHVYKAVKNNQPVAAIRIEAECAIYSPACNSQDSVEHDKIQYEVALTREVDFQLSQDLINSIQGTSFTWSLLSTEISYITHMDTLTSFPHYI